VLFLSLHYLTKIIFRGFLHSNILSQQQFNKEEYNELFKTKKDKETPLAKNMLTQVDVNNSIAGFLTTAIKNSVAKEVEAKLGNANEESLFATLNKSSVTVELIDSLRKNNIYSNVVDVRQLLKLKENPEASKDVLDKLKGQITLNNLFADSMTASNVQQGLFTNEALSSLNAVTYSGLNQSLYEATFSKKTANISMIVFWLICAAWARKLPLFVNRHECEQLEMVFNMVCHWFSHLLFVWI
jgi:hypothetical protein